MVLGWFRTTRRIKKPSKIPFGFAQCHPRCVRKECLPESVLKKVAKSLKLANSSLPTIAKHLGVDSFNKGSLVDAFPFSKEEKDKIKKMWLRPPLPKEWKDNPEVWLDSNNIRDVMKQYEEGRKDFKFLGPHPIDFAAKDPYNDDKDRCLIGEMCTLDLDCMEGIKYVGIVYNLDPHYKDGSHWVANFIDIPNKACYYFDSYGMDPPKQIEKFMQWLTIQEPNIHLGINGKRFQRTTSECGTFCLYFIDRMLAGESFLHFIRRAPPDSFMLEIRKMMYSS